jgi:outer membrane protein, multidrug efflux system
VSAFKGRILSTASPVAILMVALGLAGCSVTPVPSTPEERNIRAEADMKELFAGHTSIDQPVTLYTAQAYALKYNLDHRLKLMEQAVALGLNRLAGYDMLPQLTASAGYSTRDNDAGSSSKSLLTGIQSLEPSTSVDRTHTTANLTMAWNVLDFGVSYIRARQQSDKTLIAEERRRKVVQTIMQDVRTAYWRAVVEQRLIAELDPLMAKVQEALDRSHSIEDSRLQTPSQAMEYRKALLDTMRQLQQLRRELSLAGIELASLMNVDPSQHITLAEPSDFQVKETGAIDVVSYEKTALVNRPELREEDYQLRISADDTRKAILRMLPGIEISGNLNQDSNSFLYNKSWAEAGLKMTWNLMNLLSGPTNIEVAENQEKLADVRRLALSMAIVTQVNVGLRRFKQAQDDYKVSSELADIDSRLYDEAVVGERANTQNELEIIRRATNKLFSKLRRDLAFVEVQNSAGSIIVSIGKDPVPATVDSTDIGGLSRSLEGQAALWSLVEPVSYGSGVSTLENVPQERSVVEASETIVAATYTPPMAGEPHIAHIASYLSRKAAGKGWKTISHTVSVAGVKPVVRKVNIPGRGTMFRLYADGTDDRVRKMCSDLESKSLYCALHIRAKVVKNG